jgi:hypothetical protein
MAAGKLSALPVQGAAEERQRRLAEIRDTDLDDL